MDAIERLTREVEALRPNNAKLRTKLNLPPKTPEGKRRKSHPKAHRPLHPNPTAKRDVFVCQHCGAYFLNTPQFVCESSDHIEIPPIVPHVTRVSLLGKACLCCARKFKFVIGIASRNVCIGVLPKHQRP